jgi:hypothetical protein
MVGGVGCAADSTAGAGKIMMVAGKVTGAKPIKAEEKAVVARACGLPVGAKRASASCMSEWTVKTDWPGRADWGRASHWRVQPVQKRAAQRANNVHITERVWFVFGLVHRKRRKEVCTDITGHIIALAHIWETYYHIW